MARDRIAEYVWKCGPDFLGQIGGGHELGRLIAGNGLIMLGSNLWWCWKLGYERRAVWFDGKLWS